ncbi:hypothetical protein [Gracilinema caldarium]|uniref:Uncharacterized protein n=1 Tax=Gracilinema caldarium (strain ATCC 51460 / DSM 7334 / H1) TaxID=744872 RepID=F8F0I9_GRAC1|nr:hypothetical protein [Gracilinema caldarium]AEJ19333.1 hypothetical protein Spica_1187 [Gracilinema caldarium DSM 7334]
MSISTYLETAPLFEITKYSGNPPKDGVVFSGYPRQHPFEPEKLIFVYDPLGTNPIIMEFKLCDILFVEDQPSVVTETGESLRIVKIWVRKGAYGVIHEPFEVQDTLQFINTSRSLHERLLRSLNK